ncbi:MAG: chorismate synthase [Bacteroidales bacterium]|nr:chorismate synthase [Bacteroidales bacterium]
MASNTFGKLFSLTTFGESHGEAVGGVIDGCPAGLIVPQDFIASELTRRRPGGEFWATTRDEDDDPIFLSGLIDHTTLGSPIAFLIQNKNKRPGDYQPYEEGWRPSHADFTWEKKFGMPLGSGGGRQSARETVARVVAGAFARKLIEQSGITVQSFTRSIGSEAIADIAAINPDEANHDPLGCPDKEASQRMTALLRKLKEEGNTAGGTITCLIRNVPQGLGEPVYDKLHARLAYAMLSINAVRGFEIGEGFRSAVMNGSQHNDPYGLHKNAIRPISNHAGGVLGGISSGETIWFTVAFKPVSTLMQPQATVNKMGETIVMQPSGRHDVCVVPRARVVTEAMAALVVADMLLLSRNSKL